MKKNIIILCALTLTILYVFAAGKNIVCGVHGTLVPAAAAKILAVNGKDSVAAATASGNFTIELKPGTWKLYITAVKGYKNLDVENIIVDAGRYTDVGEIKLLAE